MQRATLEPAGPMPIDAPRRPSRVVRLVGFVAALVLRLRHLSWRKQGEEAGLLDRLTAEGKRYIAVCWHGKYIPLFSLLAGRRACVFASLSFRGQVIAEICRRFGYDCVLLPTNEARLSRKLIHEALRSHEAAAMAVDGPLGPYHRVKRGALDIGATLGFVLVPVSASGRRRRIMAERWDRREIPRLFTRVALTVGEPISVPSRLGAGDVSALKRQVHDALEALGRRADEMVAAGSNGAARTPALLPEGEKPKA